MYRCMSLTMHALSSTWSIVCTNPSTYYKHFTKTGKYIMSCQCRRTFPTVSRFSNRRKISPWLIYVFYETWNLAFSRCTRAVTAKKCTKKCTCKIVVLCVFSHDVMAAIFVPQNNETAAMFVSQTSPVGVELFSDVNAFFCCNKFEWMRTTWMKTQNSFLDVLVAISIVGS